MLKALIVDRQPLADLLISDELQSLGFACHAAPHNQSAMSSISGDRSWNLLVTEFGSPASGLGGLELSRFARTLIPQLRVLFLSRSGAPARGLARTERFLRDPYEIEELRAVVDSMDFAAQQQAARPARGERIVGQQPTGWRIDLVARQASHGDVLLGYEIAAQGGLEVTILAGGGDDEANCLIAGDAIAAIEARIRNG